jgi:hypothetical protein
MTWDTESISEGYRQQADMAQHRLDEVKRRHRDSPAYGHELDEALARFYFFNYMHGRVWLESREALLTKLREMRERSILPGEVQDPERFLRRYRSEIEHQIQRFEGPSSAQKP